MLRNFTYGGLALIGGAITGVAISSWATPLNPPQLAPEVLRVASVAQPAITLASTSSRAADDAGDCNPWEVSDVAMEVALNEMIRRGWRPPTQAEVMETFQPPIGQGAAPLDPNAPVPARRPVTSAPSRESSSVEVTETFPVDQILPTSEGTAAPAEAPPDSSPSTAPIMSEEPAPPSN